MPKKRHKPGADHRQAAGCRRHAGGGQDDWPGVPKPGDQRADVSPLASPVRRDEGRGGQAAEAPGGGEQAAEEAAGRGGTG